MAFILDDINSRAKKDPAAFIRECDAEYDAKIRRAADLIEKHREQCPIVLMSGPSGSGKTTTSKKIEEELLLRGITTYALSMDNYFRTVDDTSPKMADGSYDPESPKCVDMGLLTEHFHRLAQGEAIDVPKFNFTKQRRADEHSATIRLGNNDIVVVEGIHALNDELTTANPEALKLYISARTNVINDGEYCFKATWMRLVRRVVRDNLFRGATPDYTLSIWANIRRGEKSYISPFKEKADFKFDSSFPYEICVLKSAAQKLFANIPEGIERYQELCSIGPALEKFEDIDPKFLLPDSLLTEFLGGGKYKY
ncbi:MAG: nucleoside kinase [Firmicutes bacterium HGW-Firmicutes-16]|nr:MAG: nucleoside kinase [Firmicutes bacterium HGW-Firmicutes-16]